MAKSGYIEARPGWKLACKISSNESSTVDDMESSRIEALQRYEILDTPPDGNFDRITLLASRVFNMPIAIVSLVDEDRIWFKASQGLGDIQEIDKSPGLCASAILSDEVYLVEDARNDPRCLANPLVTGAFGLQFYAAAPLKTQDGYNLGTFCVIDKKKRYINTEQQTLLAQMADIVMHEMELRLAARIQTRNLEQRIAELEAQLSARG